MVMSTSPAAPNNVYYQYVPVPNPPLYYTQPPQQYATSPVSLVKLIVKLQCKEKTVVENFIWSNFGSSEVTAYHVRMNVGNTGAFRQRVIGLTAQN